MNCKSLNTGSFLLCFFGFITGCSLNDPGNTNNEPPLKLHAEQNLSLITLSWDPVNVTGFKEYIILQSTVYIPNAPVPEVTTETTIVKRIDSREVHSASFSNTLFAPHLCFKLYTAVNDRFLYSSTVCIDQDFTLINGFNDRAGHLDGTDKVVMFDRVDARLSTFDYKMNIVSASVGEQSLSFPVIEVSSLNDVTNVIAYDQSPPRMRKYTFPDLNFLTSRDFTSIIYSVKSYRQFVFVSVDDFDKTFYVLNRSNFSTIDSRTSINGNRNIAIFNTDPVIVLEIGETVMARYTIDENGHVVTSEQINRGVSQISTQNTTANSDDYFIGGRFGNIIDHNGELVASVNSGVNAIVLFSRFSVDKNKVLSIVSNNVKVTLDINDISSLPNTTKVDSYELPVATYSDLIVEDHFAYVVGVTFATGQSQTFILKYPI